MFVAVRAMAPVAGRPPNSGDRTLATPCAVSSTFGSWRSPDMRSATTAESNDSIAPSMATVSAGDNSVRTSCGLKAGIRSSGRPAGTAPNREPIVSTGSPVAATASEPASSAMMLPGMRRETRRQPRMTAMVPSASSVAAPDAVPAAAARTRRRSRNSPGSGGACRPNRSRICVLAIRMAMPLVKPITTGRGMYFTAVPSPVRPSRISIAPAIRVHMNSPSRP
jgi:hypothetical protein